MQNPYISDRNKMLRDRARIPGSATMTPSQRPSAAPSMIQPSRTSSIAGVANPGGARRQVDRGALNAAMGVVGPRRIQGDVSARQATDPVPGGSGVASFDGTLPDISGPQGNGVNFADPRGTNLLDEVILGSPSSAPPQIATGALAGDFSGGGLDYAPGMAPTPAPPTLDESSNSAQGGLFDLLNELLGRGGRDVGAEQEALRRQMELAQQQGIVDDRARFGAMGMGASGALAGIEMDSIQRGALDRELASQDLAARARQEDLSALAGLTGAYGDLESTAANQKELELLLQLLQEGEGGEVSSGGGIVEDVTGALSDVALTGLPIQSWLLDQLNANSAPREGNGIYEWLRANGALGGLS